jgi:AcrR family transcriptional regulator
VPASIGRPARPHLRDDFVDAAQRLIQAKGYEPMSIEDVLRETGVSKGAFYHYFRSKAELLDAVVDRFADTAVARLTGLAETKGLTATERLQRFFSGTMAWKTAHRQVLLELLRVWQSDDNAVVREKLRRNNVRRITPLLARILRDGREPGEFTTSDPEQAATVAASLILATADALGERILAHRPGDEDDARQVLRVARAYSDGLERVVGARPGSLTIADEPMLRAWLP